MLLKRGCSWDSETSFLVCLHFQISTCDFNVAPTLEPSSPGVFGVGVRRGGWRVKVWGCISGVWYVCSVVNARCCCESVSALGWSGGCKWEWATPSSQYSCHQWHSLVICGLCELLCLHSMRTIGIHLFSFRLPFISHQLDCFRLVPCVELCCRSRTL